jgi:hypothetical protein
LLEILPFDVALHRSHPEVHRWIGTPHWGAGHSDRTRRLDVASATASLLDVLSAKHSYPPTVLSEATRGTARQRVVQRAASIAEIVGCIRKLFQGDGACTFGDVTLRAARWQRIGSGRLVSP